MDVIKMRDKMAGGDRTVVNDLPSYTVDLPSWGVFYPGRQSSVRVTPLLVSQARQIKAANNTRDEGSREREIANIVGRSILNFNVFDLTVGDYEFLARWLKLNSYKKSPYRIEWEYPTVDAAGAAYSKKVVSVIKNSDVRVVECEKHLVPELGYETVRDRVETLALEDESDREVAGYAAVLPGKDIVEKIAKLDRMEVEYLAEIRRHQAKCRHGIDEHVTLRDMEVDDSPSFSYELKFDIKDFFP